MKYLLGLATCVMTFGAFAQVVRADEWEGIPAFSFPEVDKKPIWPGCETLLVKNALDSCFTQNLAEFINQEFQFPPTTQNLGIEGKIWIGFIIEEDGSLGPVTLLRSVEPYVDNEAIRVIQTLPPMAQPGFNDGKPVRTRYALPINVFTLPINVLLNSSNAES